MDYGKLAGITGPEGGIAQIWFQDGSLTKRMVQFNYGKNFIIELKIRIITRK